MNKSTIIGHGDNLSPFLTDLRKNQNTHHCLLLKMLEKWRCKLEKEKIKKVIFINLSKPFNHNFTTNIYNLQTGNKCK